MIYISEIELEKIKIQLGDISIRNKPLEMKEVLLDSNICNTLKIEKLLEFCMENKIIEYI
ncbi:MAG: hypothetical protein KFW09_04975 [Oscillospiraceae bacterium]|nr:hypothetical protein [Oscillospiraceae bacterium]